MFPQSFAGTSPIDDFSDKLISYRDESSSVKYVAGSTTDANRVKSGNFVIATVGI